MLQADGYLLQERGGDSMSDFELLSLVFTVLFGLISTVGIIATVLLNVMCYIQKTILKKTTLPAKRSSLF